MMGIPVFPYYHLSRMTQQFVISGHVTGCVCHSVIGPANSSIVAHLTVTDYRALLETAKYDKTCNESCNNMSSVVTRDFSTV